MRGHVLSGSMHVMIPSTHLLNDDRHNAPKICFTTAAVCGSLLARPQNQPEYKGDMAEIGFDN